MKARIPPLVMAALLVGVVGFTGCVEVRAPERIDVGWGDRRADAGPEPDDRARAAEKDRETLIDENVRLREQLRRAERECDEARDRIEDLQEQRDDCRAEMSKIERERDRYKREAERYEEMLDD